MKSLEDEKGDTLRVGGGGIIQVNHSRQPGAKERNARIEMQLSLTHSHVVYTASSIKDT